MLGAVAAYQSSIATSSAEPQGAPLGLISSDTGRRSQVLSNFEHHGAVTYEEGGNLCAVHKGALWQGGPAIHQCVAAQGCVTPSRALCLHPYEGIDTARTLTDHQVQLYQPVACTQLTQKRSENVL